MEDWVTIRNLKSKNPELSNREIGRLLGISHNTVKSAVEKENLPQYNRKAKASEKLQPFEEVIFEMVNVKRYKGSRIFEELKSKGYTGGKTILYDYLRKIKLSKQKTFTPYETGPAEQAQFDWSPYTVEIGGVLSKIYLFSYIKGFSRYQILEVSLSENQGAVFEALEKSLLECGGSPSRLQTDNAKVFVKNSSKNNFQWNTRYLHFCGHYGFEPARSLPRHPWSKGKVERPFAYIEDHFIAGASFNSFEELYSKLKEFQNKLNNRIHSTTKQTPAELFEKEKPSLLKLPSGRYIGVKEEIRKVTFDCLISFNGSRYSVPWFFAGGQVWIRVSQGFYLEVYSQENKLAARHKLSLKKGAVVIEQKHYRNNNLKASSFDRLKKVFLELFPEQNLFLEKLKAQKRINAQHHLYKIIELSKHYKKEDFSCGLQKAFEYNVFNYSFILGYLQKNFTGNYDQTSSILQLRDNRNTPPPFSQTDIKRNMKEYQLELLLKNYGSQ